jgi:glutathione synthase/RimK-type ligase-like ATP-grasp enzyme
MPLLRRAGLVTYHREPTLTEDDRPLISALAEQGLEGVAVRWDDRGADWSAYSALVIRSCWDYHVRHDEFVQWLDELDRAGVPVFNPVALVRWNMDKRYLRELQQRGIAIPETQWLERGSTRSLAQLLRDAGWTDAIVKPAVSASATDTWRASTTSVASDEARFRELTARAAVLVQRYVAEIETRGEWSLVFIDGRLSHAGLKRPRSGDFRVQKEHGGTSTPAEPPPAVADASRAVMDALPHDCFFARIDGVETGAGYVLMEAECIEPDLFFRFRPEARAELARAVSRRSANTS